MAQGGPRLQGDVPQLAGSTKLLLYYGPESSGEVMAKFLKAYGWGWQRISQKSPLKQALHNAKQAMDGQDQMIVCADGSHSEGAWANAANKCSSTVRMIALHVANFLRIAAGPGQPPAPCICASNPSEAPGPDLQLVYPKKGRFSAVITANTAGQLHAALSFLCNQSRQQPPLFPVNRDGQVDYRQHPYAAIHFIKVSKSPLASEQQHGGAPSPVAWTQGQNHQQPHDNHCSSRQPQAGQADGPFPGEHPQSHAWDAFQPSHATYKPEAHPLQQQQQMFQQSPAWGWGMQSSGLNQPFQAQAGGHNPHMGGFSPHNGGQAHPQWGPGMQQGRPVMGMGWGSQPQPPPHPHAWRQGGPIPFNSFAPDDLLAPPYPGQASLLQDPPHAAQQNTHHGQPPISMQGQWDHGSNNGMLQDGRISSGHAGTAGTAPTPITAQASHRLQHSGRMQGQGGHTQNATAYPNMSMNAMGQSGPGVSLMPGDLQSFAAHGLQQVNGMQMQPSFGGPMYPENVPFDGYSHPQPSGMQMQSQHRGRNREAQPMAGNAATAGQSRKHWKKQKKELHAQEAEAGAGDHLQGQSRKPGKKQRTGGSNGEADVGDQNQLPKNRKLSRKQRFKEKEREREREKEREAMPDYDMVQWLSTGLLPAWWTTERGSPTRISPAVAADRDGPNIMAADGDGLSTAAEGVTPGYGNGNSRQHAAAEHAFGTCQDQLQTAAGDSSRPGLGEDAPAATAAEQLAGPRADLRSTIWANLSHSREGITDQQDAQAGEQGGDEVLAEAEVPYRDECPPDEPIDLRPLLLFDLNGTLTAHTSARKSSGKSEMRPGLHHLRRLQEHFRLGIFTSSSRKTVQAVIPLLEAAAGPGPRLFSRPELVLYRDHTLPAAAAHVEAGGNFWDTCKPLVKWFSRLHHTILFDDDAYKAYRGEKSNMVLVPCWAEADAHDSCIAVIVDAVLEVLGPLGANDDLRAHTPQLTERITRGVQAIARKEMQQIQMGEVSPVC
ncbi:hypothetical protein WJX74_003146 [Apatococcus lobatus]|uniref:FCP1 homology domain-containing protein n=1 Tax=Apatococcus lobatus TaxID=904363 RepID=A0AAW1QI91_9CHLO